MCFVRIVWFWSETEIMAKRKRRRVSSSRSGRRGGKGGSGGTVASLPADQRDRVEFLMKQGKAFRMQQNLPRARQCYEGVLALLPDYVSALLSLSQCVARMRDIDTGIELGRRAIGIDPFSALLHGNLADILLMGGDTEGATECAERALEIDPHQIFPRIILSQIAEQEGDYDRAIGYLRRAMKELPSDPHLIHSLARVYRFNKQVEEARQLLEPLLEREDLPSGIRIKGFHEIGMVYDQLGRSDEAYSSFEEYSRLMKEAISANDRSKGFQFDIIRDYGEYLRDNPDGLKRFAEMGERLRGVDVASGRPRLAFLVGFPRSGTTMTEQIFDSHGEIVGVEEPPYLEDMKKRWREMVGNSGDIKGDFDRLDEEQIVELRRYFWSLVDDDLGAEALDSAAIFVYKHPLLINELSFINVIFPDSKVIVALRDPRDCCLSCFMQDFGASSGMIHFLSLVDTCELYDAVFGLYLSSRELFTFDCIEIRYEDTVRDLEAQARRCIEFFDLEWDPAVLRFHERAREKYIPTPSFAAVNEPVNTKAIARWKRYEKYFEPCVAYLSPYVREFGYGEEV